MKRPLALHAGLKALYDKAMLLVKNSRPIILGLAGGSAAGKTYVAQKLAQRMQCSLLSLDDYYVGRTNMPDENFDTPDVIELDLLKQHLVTLQQNKPIWKPKYNYVPSERSGYEYFKPSPVVIVEGLFALHKKIIADLSLKIFVDAREDIRFNRRLERDREERGYSEDYIKTQWNETVQKMHVKHVEPQRRHADFIIKNA